MNAGARRLIVTADDFGLTPQVNEAVIRGCQAGVLRFASLMVTAPAAAEAVDRARRECPELGVGLHLVLCSGRSALAPASIPGLVDAQGSFPDDPAWCGLRYFFGRDLHAPLEREIRAQFERFLAFGLRPGHVDGHANIHAHPVVYPMLVRLAREYGFDRVRLPGGELAASLRYGTARLPKQLLEAAVFGALRAYLSRVAADSRVRLADRTWGLLRSGLMGEGYVLSALKSLPGGLSEMYFHPTSDPQAVAVDEPRPGHHSVTDLQALTSPRVRERIEALGIELVRPAFP